MANPDDTKPELVEQLPDEVLLKSKETSTEIESPEVKPQIITSSPKEVAPQELSKEPSTSLQLKVELSFVLGNQMIPMEELNSLVVGKVISLGGSQFEASVMLQEKTIAQADLILVEGVPALQITKIVSP